MFISDLSIRRPVFATVLMLALVTLGAFSYTRLPIDLEPNIEIPVVTIVTKYPGASPATIERELSKRIEEAVNPIAGVKFLNSISREGVSLVIIEFYLEYKISEAADEVRAKVAAVRGSLPRGIEDPIVQKIDIAGAPVVSVALRSSNLSPRELTTLAERKIKRRIEGIPGVGKVDLVGTSKREVQVELDPAKLDSFGMGVDEVIAGLQSENVNTPLGRITGSQMEATLRVQGKPENAADYAKMVIANRSGKPVALADVAHVEDGQEEPRSLALADGVPSVALNIMRQSGSNVVQTVEWVLKQVDLLRKELPPGTEIDVVRDDSVLIQESVRDLKRTILVGGLLTVFIVYCFLNSWRSTVITGLTLPISVVSSFMIMNFCGMSINFMTMMGLSLVIGLLIDDAIVVRENIVRHLLRGKDHFTAAKDGTDEIGLAVLATTFSIIAVFVPVAFMKGIVGRYFFQFGVTVAFAVLVSLVVSFTLDPMLSSRWIDPDLAHKGRRRGFTRLLDHFNAWFERTADRYHAFISWSLHHRFITVLTAASAFCGGLYVMSHLESEFMTEWDRGELGVSFKTAPNASFEETKGRLNEMLERLKTFPEIQRTYATIGAGDSGTVRSGGIYVKLVKRHEREKSQEQLRREIREKLITVPGVICSVEAQSHNNAQKPLQIQVRGENIDYLKKIAIDLKRKLYEVPGIVDLEVPMEFEQPEYRLVVDRQRTADAGVMTDAISTTLGTLVGGIEVTTFEDQEGEAVDVRLRMPKEQREDITQIGGLRVVGRGPAGPKLLPLSDLVKMERSTTPTEITRKGMRRQVTVSANLAGIALGTAMKDVTSIADKMQLPAGYTIGFTGEADDMTETFVYMAEALLLAVISVYLILAAQFESFLDPLAIMLSLPLSILGMAGMLYFTGDTVNIMSLIGLIMLMGLVTKNAILLVDYAKVLRSCGMPRHEAVVVAGRTRLRPIMMTTLAMILGMLPMACNFGEGSEWRAPMGRAIVGGLLTSTLLTLVVVPVVYTLLDDVEMWLLRRRKDSLMKLHEEATEAPAK